MQIKSTVARLLGAASTDPAHQLKRSIRELEDQVPRLNEGLAHLKAQVVCSERELAALRERDAELEAKVVDAWERERPDVAANYALTQDEIRRRIAREEAQLTLAQTAFARGQRLKRAFMLHKEETIQLAKEALAAQRQAEWNRRVAATLGELQLDLGTLPDPTVTQLQADEASSRLELWQALERVLEADDLERDQLQTLVAVTRNELRGLSEQLAHASARLERLEARLARLDG